MVGLTHWMQFEARARLATKLYSSYSAGANERSNEEMRRCVSPIWYTFICMNSISPLLESILSIRTLVWILFFSAAVLFGIMTLIFFFHWTQYKMTVKLPKLLVTVYLSVGLLLLAFMGSIALSYLA